MLAKTRKFWLLTLLILTLVLVSYFHFRINFDDLSVDQLTAGGYYAYLLPDNYTASLGWTRNISLNSFDYQCHSFFLSDSWNPVEVRYKDTSGNLVLQMRIEEQDAIFDDGKVLEIVPINVSWISNQQGTAYSLGDRTELKVHDNLGQEIVFSSSLGRDDLQTLIANLQYAGPPVEYVGNPWIKVCE